MDIYSSSMTGQDLKNLYDVSNMKGADFAKKLGISRPMLYILFKDNIIEEKIQGIIESDPELSKLRQLFNKPTVQDKENENPYDALNDFNKVLQNYVSDLRSNNEFLLKIANKVWDSGAVIALPEKLKGMKI